MRPHLLACVVLVGTATAAQAQLPEFNAQCPTDIMVHADRGGPVYINGHHARLERHHNHYFEALHGGVTISISLLEDGTLDVAYTRANGNNGVCQLVVYHGAAHDVCPADVSEADRYRYPGCN